MRRLFFLGLFLSSFTAAAQSPDCECPATLREVWTHLLPLPAFADRCTDGSCAETFTELYEDAIGARTDLACYRLLSALVATLRDNHTVILGAGPDSLWMDRLGDGAQVPADPAAERYRSNLGAFDLLLPPDGGEGVLLTAGGDTVAFLTPRGNDRYRYAGRWPYNGRLVTITEQLRSGAFHHLGLRRDTTRTYHSRYPRSGEPYAYEQRTPDLGYLRLATFHSYQPTLREAEAFYATLPGQLGSGTLIVDLRDNTGGGDRNSDIVFTILKQHRKQYDAIYVLVNHGTTSNGEQFAVRLSKWKNVILAGERTRGMLAYELQGRSEEVGCGKYILSMATRRHRKYLPYEITGVPVTLLLSAEQDWVEAIAELSGKN